MNRYGKWIIALAGLIVGALLLSPVTAHVNNRFGHLWNDHIKSKADKRYEALAKNPWARVAENGTLVKGRGIEDTSRDSAGVYFVFFKRNVDQCAGTATVWASNLFATIGPAQGDDTVAVRLLNTVNNPVDGPFAIMMRC